MRKHFIQFSRKNLLVAVLIVPLLFVSIFKKNSKNGVETQLLINNTYKYKLENLEGIEKSYPHLLKLLEIAKKNNDIESIAFINYRLSALFYHMNLYNQALDYAKLSLSSYKKLNDTINVCAQSLFISSIYDNKGDTMQAIDQLKNLELLSIYPNFINEEKNKYNSIYTKVLYRLSDLYLKADLIALSRKFALQAYENSYALSKEMLFNRANALIYRKEGNEVKELETINLVLNSFPNKSALGLLPYFLRAAELYIKQGNDSKAKELLSIAERIKLSCVFGSKVSVNSNLERFQERFRVLYLLDSLSIVKKDAAKIFYYTKLMLSAKDTIYYLNSNKQLLEIKTLTDEVDLKLLLSEERHKRTKLMTYIVSLCVTLILLLLLILIYVVSKRKIRLKNVAILKLRDHSVISIDKGLVGDDYDITTKNGIADKKADQDTRDDNELEDDKDSLGRNSEYNLEAYSKVVTSLDEEDYSLLFKNMEEVMRDKKPYLKAQLKRGEFARLICTNETYLYYTIKAYTSYKNFSDYINFYRVKYACDMIKTNPKLSLETVATESGFNGRQSFYRVFCSYMSMSPKEYRDALNLLIFKLVYVRHPCVSLYIVIFL